MGELLRCLRNRRNALRLFTVYNGKEGGRYEMNAFFMPKRYKPGDLPCVLETDFLRRCGKGVRQPFLKRLVSLVFYPNVFAGVRVFILTLFMKEIFL